MQGLLGAMRGTLCTCRQRRPSSSSSPCCAAHHPALGQPALEHRTTGPLGLRCKPASAPKAPPSACAISRRHAAQPTHRGSTHPLLLGHCPGGGDVAPGSGRELRGCGRAVAAGRGQGAERLGADDQEAVVGGDRGRGVVHPAAARMHVCREQGWGWG